MFLKELISMAPDKNNSCNNISSTSAKNANRSTTRNNLESTRTATATTTIISDANCEDIQGRKSCHDLPFPYSRSNDDPREILRASLEFQRSQMQQQNEQPPFPAQVTIGEARNSSSTTVSSLYPSMEDISRNASDFDSEGIEQYWQNAAISRKQNGDVQSLNRVSISDDTNSSVGLPHHFPDSLSSRYNNNLSACGSLYGHGSNPVSIPSNDVTSSLNIATLSERGDPTTSDSSKAFLIPNSDSIGNSGLPLTCRSEVNLQILSTTIGTRAVVEADTLAEAIVEYDMIHPLEEESAVRAEFVCQRRENDETNYDCQPNESGTSVSVSFCGRSSNEGIATEATVIEAGPLEKATIEAWSGDTNEAVVIQQPVGLDSYKSINDLDRKPPAIRVHNEVSNNITPLRERQQQQQQNFENEIALATVEDNAIATVVDYDVHPSEMMDQSAQAEFVGSSTANAVVSPFNNLVESITEMNATEGTTEATVLDSGPAEKATAEAWSTTITEEAQVLLEDNYEVDLTIAAKKEKESLSCTFSSFRSAIATEDVNTSNDNQTEVTEISDSIHPAELNLGVAATVELIEDGPNRVFDAVIHSDHVLDEATSAEIIVEEAQLQSLDEIDGQNEQPITPATILDVDNSTDNQYGDYSQKLISNDCLDNATSDGVTELKSMQFSLLECQNTNNEDRECIEDQHIPIPRQPPSSGATTPNTSHAANDGSNGSNNLPTVQTVSTNRA